MYMYLYTINYYIIIFLEHKGFINYQVIKLFSYDVKCLFKYT